MYCYRFDLSWKVKDDRPPEYDIEEKIYDYFGSLYHNGQIFYEYEVVRTDAGYGVYATLPEKDSTDKKYYNKYVRGYEENILRFFDITRTYLGEAADCGEPCACKKSSWYLLFTDSSGDSPVSCGDCGRSVPLYKLPHINDCEYFEILEWQQEHVATERMYMKGLSDRFTARQMNDPESRLSREGRDICKAIEEKTGIPAYYYLDNNVYFTKKFSGVCPVCGEKWARMKTGKVVDCRCEKCRLATDIPPV